MPNLRRTRSNWRSFMRVMFSPSTSTSPVSGLSRPMRCFSKTLLPPPLRPMITADSPLSIRKSTPIQDQLRAEAFAQLARFDHDMNTT